MEIVYLSVICAVLGLGALFSLTAQFQMLQQNSYFYGRYLKWVKSSFNLCVQFIYSFLILFLLTRHKFLIAVLLSAFLTGYRIMAAISKQKKSIKPLVFTARIKRFYVCAAVVFVLLIALMIIFKGSLLYEICLCIAVLLSCISVLLCLVCRTLTAPVDMSVNRYYINSAKKILKENKNLTVVGVTGSYGKTTTKFILNRILSEKFNTVCTPASFNTPLGAVRTIREKIEPKTQIFICEMGAKKTGDIKEICDIVKPEYGIITSVGKQHLDTFFTLDNVFKTKFELADAVEKICFANIDSDGIKTKEINNKKVILFGSGTDYRIENIKSSVSGTTFDLILKDSVINAHTKLLGLLSLSDILAAAALAYTLGVDENSIKFAISTLKSPEHRLELKSFIGGSLCIDDAYNSNPEGCLEAVRVLGTFEGFKKTVITPGLVELGEKEYDCNFALGQAATKYADRIILVGKNRSKPMLDAIKQTDFNIQNVFVVQSFKEGLEIYKTDADENSILLIENDLPDNYLN